MVYYKSSEESNLFKGGNKMPIMEKTQTKKSIWVSLKEVFWDCDEIGEEVQINGSTPEETAELLKAQALADQRYANLNSSNNNSAKGGKGNFGKSIEVGQGKVDPLKAMELAGQKAAKSKGEKVEENQK